MGRGFMHQRVALNDWYRSPLGQYLTSQIKTRLDSFLSTSFGYYAITLGGEGIAAELMDSCRVNHVFHLGQGGEGQQAFIDNASLPIAADSTDLVVLIHALSESSDPHAILREVNRVLIPDGKLIIIDFNPLSFWGLRHLTQAWLDDAPWSGHYYTARRLKDWASLLGFERLAHYHCGYVLPLNYPSLISRSHIISKFSERWLGFSSALNVLIFEKNTIPITPVRSRWVKRQILSANAVRPTLGRGMKYLKNDDNRVKAIEL